MFFGIVLFSSLSSLLGAEWEANGRYHAVNARVLVLEVLNHEKGTPTDPSGVMELYSKSPPIKVHRMGDIIICEQGDGDCRI